MMSSLGREQRSELILALLPTKIGWLVKQVIFLPSQLVKFLGRRRNKK